MNLQQLLMLPVILVAMYASTAAEKPDVLMVDSFDLAVQNERGGYRSTYARAPSRADMLRVDNIGRTSTGRSLRIRAVKDKQGFCGLWLHLFDKQNEKPQFFDARPYRYISFWVKGERGGETFEVRLADRHWINREDSVSFGAVEEFLPEGVTTDWREVLVPLRPAGGLDLSQIGALVLNFDRPGEFNVSIDDVSLKTDSHQAGPSHTPQSSDRSVKEALPRSLWVWSTKDLIGNHGEQAAFFDFCQGERIRTIWLQLLYEEVADDKTLPATDNLRLTIANAANLQSFIAEAHQRGIAVHALDGAPEYCLKENHAIPLAIVDAVMRFNEASSGEKRFDGIHFDNEPYLLIGWQNRPMREQMLREFLDLNAECQRRVAERSTMQYGVDLPFWWHAIDRETGEAIGAVSFRGVRKSASQHCIDLLDNVGIMNYRDAADGADGMMAHGRDLLAYSDRTNGATIYMGVETYMAPPMRIWFPVGLPRPEFQQALITAATSARSSSILSRRVYTLDDGENVHVGLKWPALEDERQNAEWRASAQLLVDVFGASGREDLSDRIDRLRDRARLATESDAEWLNFHIVDLASEHGFAEASGFCVDRLMLPKITFADNSYDDFQEQTQSAEDFFQCYRSYGGLALHHYDSMRRLRESRRQH